MNEPFYQLYKSLRDLVFDFADKDLSETFKDFVLTTKANCDRHDRTNLKYLHRWQNERFLLFRFHRGGLDESMETVTIIESFEELLVLAIDFWDSPFTKLTVEPYVYDQRIHWDTQLVLIHVRDKSYPIGYLNRDPKWSHKQGEVNEVSEDTDSSRDSNNIDSVS